MSQQKVKERTLETLPHVRFVNVAIRVSAGVQSVPRGRVTRDRVRSDRRGKQRENRGKLARHTEVVEQQMLRDRTLFEKRMLTTLRPRHVPRRALDRPQPWPIYGRPV